MKSKSSKASRSPGNDEAGESGFGGRMARWERVSVAASKQSLRCVSHPFQKRLKFQFLRWMSANLQDFFQA